MRHDPASGAIVIMLRSLKMHGMAQAVTDLIEQAAPAFEAAVPILSQLLKAEMEMHFLDQLHEDDLQALADSIRERIDGLKRRKRDGDP